MAKDPRFNFYPDNYMGGTIGFTLEQHGAYLQLIILNFQLGPFTDQQALDHLSQLTRGNTAVYTALWNFLIPKFDTDGSKFWSARLMKEKMKSKVHSEKQSERVNKRWNKGKDQSGINNGNTTVLPVNGTGIGNGIGTGSKEERVQGEEPTFEDYEKWTESIVSGNDWLFQDKLRNLGISVNDKLAGYAQSHLSLIAKYPKMQPSDQNRFRVSLIGHISEKQQESSNGNGSSKTEISLEQLKQSRNGHV